MTDVAASQEVIRHFMGFIPARAIYVAAKLGIADLISDGGTDIGKLAKQLDVDSAALLRLLRLLSALNLVQRDNRRLFVEFAAGGI